MEITKDKDKRRGLIGTILFHAVLLLIFVFYGMTYTVPPPPEEGITINFGTSEDGMGDVQPVEPVSSSQEQTPEEEITPENTPTPTETAEEAITQDIEEAPKVVKKNKEIIKKEEPKKEEPKPSKNLSKALDKWKNKSKAQQANEGETGKPGDQGSLDGDPNSKNRIGGGSGSGVTFNLAGRKMLAPPRIKDNSQEEGKVVVDITVDKYGKVVRAVPGGRGSTTTSSILYKKAKEAALRTKFNAKVDAAVEQKGQMTFIFILN